MALNDYPDGQITIADVVSTGGLDAAGNVRGATYCPDGTAFIEIDGAGNITAELGNVSETRAVVAGQTMLGRYNRVTAATATGIVKYYK